MKWSLFGRAVLGLMSAMALGLGMTACGGGTIAYMWAVGNTAASGAATGSGIIVGYKVDNFSGNLTAVPGQPFTSNGTNPVQVVVRPGGRFLYVINQGTGFSGTSAGSSEGIDEFAIGGEGALTFEQHYDTTGRGHLWATFDTSGNYFYVLDKYSPTYQPDPNNKTVAYDPNGAIFAFTSDANTGRLFPAGQTNFALPNTPAPLYVEVGSSPVRMASNGSCVFAVNSANQTLSIFSLSGGQLGTVTTGTYAIQGATSINSITVNGNNMFLTDNGASRGLIYNYTVPSCNPTPFTTGPVIQEDQGTANPTNVFVTTRGQYVYILNANNANTNPTTQGSSVSGYNIINATLTELNESPYPSGAGPYCMVEDPSSNYLYTSNSTDGSITGFRYTDSNGILAGLQRGSNFKTSALNLSCLAITGVI